MRSGEAPTGAASPAPQSPAPGFVRLCVVLLVLLGFSLGCTEFVVIGVEPQIAEAFDVSLAGVGQTISCFAVAYALCTPVLSLCTGRFRRYQLLVGYSVVFCLANVLQVLAPNFLVLLASRVLIGSVSGALLAVGLTYIPELVGFRRTSMILSFVYAAFSVAMVVITSVGKLVADLVDWHLAPVGTLVLAIVVCAALVVVMPREGATDEVATAREQMVLLREPNVPAGMAIFVFGVGSVYVFYGYVTPYVEQVLGLGTAGASATLMAYGVVTLASNLLSGWLDARFGVRALLVTFPIQALMLLALFLIGGATAPALAAIMAVGLTMYLASVPCVSMFMRTARDRCPKALTLASSLEPVAFNVGIAFGTAMGGLVVSGPGLSHVGLVGAGFSLVAWALAAWVVRLAAKEHVAR